MVAKENPEMSASELSPSNTPCYCGCDSLYSRSHSSRSFCNILIFPKIIHKHLSGELDLPLRQLPPEFPRLMDRIREKYFAISSETTIPHDHSLRSIRKEIDFSEIQSLLQIISLQKTEQIFTKKELAPFFSKDRLF